MLLEMLLLLVIALGVFLYVLAPIVRPQRQAVQKEPVAEAEPERQSEAVSSEQQTVHEPS